MPNNITPEDRKMDIPENEENLASSKETPRRPNIQIRRMLGLLGVCLVRFYRCNSSKDQIAYDLILVCFFLHNSRVTSTEVYCKHKGQDIFLNVCP